MPRAPHSPPASKEEGAASEPKAQVGHEEAIPSPVPATSESPKAGPSISAVTRSGEKAKAEDILQAIRVLKQIKGEHRPATTDERNMLARFGGFGAVALSLFPDPVTETNKNPTWQALGMELSRLLSPAEDESARRTVFNAFYTSPVVIDAMYRCWHGSACPRMGRSSEPGCGSGRFMGQAPAGMRFIGVELDGISGRIAKALHPHQDIRTESFRRHEAPRGGS